MSSPRSLVRSLAWTVLLGLASAGLTAPAVAADLGLPVAPEEPVLEQNVEFGTGWYIRGDVAYANDSLSPLTPDLTQFLSSIRQNSLSLGGGFGYKFTNMFRADVTGDYRKVVSAAGVGTPVQCITRIQDEPDPSGSGATVPLATAHDNCTPNYSSSIRRWDLLANGYIDFGTWYGFTPYIGAGAGLSITRTVSSVNWFMSNGLPYHVSTDGFFFNWDRSQSDLRYQFAWALMAGTSYEIMPHLLLDFGYRYINLGKLTTFQSPSGLTESRSMNAHELRLGIRYMID